MKYENGKVILTWEEHKEDKVKVQTNFASKMMEAHNLKEIEIVVENCPRLRSKIYAPGQTNKNQVENTYDWEGLASVFS